jgi:hypothetical protein
VGIAAVMSKRQQLNLIGLYSIKNRVWEAADIDPSYVREYSAPAKRRLRDLGSRCLNLIEESSAEHSRTLTEPGDGFP